MLVLVATTSFASYATAYSPANFGDAQSVLSQKVQVPASFGDRINTLAVYCQADVMTSGALQNLNCIDNGPNDVLLAPTTAALQSATFTPANVDGKAVPVRMQFRVIYSHNEGQAPIMLLPNLGTLQSKYGLTYSAPQERLDKNDWFSAYSEKQGKDAKLFFAKSKVTRIKAEVTSSGKVTSVDTIEAAARKKSDADSISASVRNTRFIPGFVGNKPTDLHYFVVLNYKK